VFDLLSVTPKKLRHRHKGWWEDAELPSSQDLSPSWLPREALEASGKCYFPKIMFLFATKGNYLGFFWGTRYILSLVWVLDKYFYSELIFLGVNFSFPGIVSDSHNF
jgi:hypothetical protein